jgi:hypothetical protein
MRGFIAVRKWNLCLSESIGSLEHAIQAHVSNMLAVLRSGSDAEVEFFWAWKDITPMRSWYSLQNFPGLHCSKATPAREPKPVISRLVIEVNSCHQFQLFQSKASITETRVGGNQVDPRAQPCRRISIRAHASMVLLTVKKCTKRKSNQEGFMAGDQRFYNHFCSNQYYSLGNENIVRFTLIYLLRRPRIRN